MNIAIRKLAMLEKTMVEQEEALRLEGYSTCPINPDLQRQIKYLMDRIRYVY